MKPNKFLITLYSVLFVFNFILIFVPPFRDSVWNGIACVVCAVAIARGVRETT